MNSYDSDRLLESVRGTHEQVKSPESADVIVFNTCHIREKAAEKIYSELWKIKEIKANRAINSNSQKRTGHKEIIIKNYCMHAIISKKFTHRTTSIRSQKLKWSRIGSSCSNNDRVF